MLKKLLTGVKRRPKKFFLSIIFGYTTLWTLLEPIFTIFEIKTSGYDWCFLIGYFLLSLLISLFVIYPSKKVQFELKNTNTKVEITFGDLFETDGHKVIAVSEYFDSKIGKPVSPRSLHGIFLEKILEGHIEILDNAVNNQLRDKVTEEVNRVDGKNLKYELGTTITISYKQSLYFLFALSVSDFECNVYSYPSLMLKALDGLWEKVRLEGNGIDINLPLIGNGLSRVGIPPNQLLQLMLISLLKSAKERDLCSTVRIVLSEDIFDKIDLEMIKSIWQN
jgi:hypothetical protein